MDWTMLFIFIGLLFTGSIIGYPLGHLFGRREALGEFGFSEPKPVKRARRNLERKDVLFAEYLEVKE